jgi:hypothetical protein
MRTMALLQYDVCYVPQLFGHQGITLHLVRQGKPQCSVHQGIP